ALCASADPLIGKPSVDLAKAVAFEQPATKCIALLRLLRRKRLAAVQPQEDQLRMHLANVARAMRAHEGVDLHDLRPEMPELARHALLPAQRSFPIGLVRIGKLLPEPAPCTGEDARSMRLQRSARQKIACALTVIGHADGNVDAGAVKGIAQRSGDVGVERD